VLIIVLLNLAVSSSMFDNLATMMCAFFLSLL